MAYDASAALRMFMARRDYLKLPPMKEEYLHARIEAAALRLKKNGIHLQDTADDLMLLVDMSVWDEQNRDKPGAMPEWLKIARRERWLSDRAAQKAAQEGDGDDP